MKKLALIAVTTTMLLTVGSCGNKNVQQQVENQQEDEVPANLGVPRDTTVYGICGGGTAMNTLQLITDIGDTLIVSTLNANEKGRCFGGYQVGDRMAVLMASKDTALQVINQSALLGDWVTPNPIDGTSEMGIRIKEGGVAESIDQPSLLYRSWKLFNGKLEIVAIREEANDEVETYLYDFVFLGPDSLVFKDTEDTYIYNRYRERKHRVNIELEDASAEEIKL